MKDEQKFFDLHTHGIGYLYRAREVSVQRGGNFWAVDISALHGSADAVQYTRFDCRVSGQNAEGVIQRFANAINDDNQKVLIGFRLSDQYLDTFPSHHEVDLEDDTQTAIEAGIKRVLTEANANIESERAKLLSENLTHFIKEVTRKAIGKTQQRTVIKARLLFIQWVKVNGETLYSAPKREAQPAPTANDVAQANGQVIYSETSVSAAQAHGARGEGQGLSWAGV